MIQRHGWTIQVRMTLLASSVAALVCILMSVLIVIAVHGRVAHYKREQVEDAALRIAPLIERGRLPPVLPAKQVPAMQVVNARGRVVAATPQLTGKPPIAAFRPAEDDLYAVRVLCPPRGLPGCMIVASVRVYQPDGNWYVYAADHKVPWYTSGELVAFLAGLSVLLVMITAIGAYRTVSRTLEPVEAIRRELAEITGSDLGRRVPVPEHPDEIRRLAETVNATLDRLQAALEQLRRFTLDASHDLRSPITAMRTQAEDALQHPDETDWQEAGRAILVSLDRLQAIVADLLMLARLEAEPPGAREPVDLADLVAAELERRPRPVPVVTRLQPRVVVLGDALRLNRLLTNLIDNAERHAVSQITVTVRAEGSVAVLEVLDDGSGIPPDQREVVFRRFTRLEPARRRDAGGTGLGLPIARQVAEAHGGTLRIEDSARGARLVLRLPRAGDSGQP